MVNGKYVGTPTISFGDVDHSLHALQLEVDDVVIATVDGAVSSATSFDIDEDPSTISLINGSHLFIGTEHLSSVQITGISGSTITVDTAVTLSNNQTIYFSPDSFQSNCRMGYQLVHNVITNLTKDRWYTVRCRVNMLDDGYIPSNQDAFGPFGFYHKSPAIGDTAGAANVTIDIMNDLDGALNDWSTFKNAANKIQSWNFKFSFQALTNGGLSFLKRNDVSVEIDRIQIEDAWAAPVRIQPLVFEPKPDYAPGDVIKMTNTNAAPNGDKVTVTVKLGDEQLPRENKFWTSKTGGLETTEGYDEFVSADNESTFAPDNWIDDITISTHDMIDDSDCILGSGQQRMYDYLETTNAQNQGFAFDSGPDLNIGTVGTSADWSTHLNMISNSDFTLADDSDTVFGGGYSNRAKNWTPWDHNDNENSSSWVWHDGYSSGNKAAELYNGTGRVHNWNNFDQYAGPHGFNPRLQWDTGGTYKLTWTLSNYSGSGTSHGIFPRLYTHGAFRQGTFQSSNGTYSETLNAPMGATGTQRLYNSLHFQCRDDNNSSGNYGVVNTARLDNIYLFANNNVNRLTWGTQTGTTGIHCVAGTSMQIAAYPAKTNGVKATGAAGNGSSFLGSELMPTGAGDFSNPSLWTISGGSGTQWILNGSTAQAGTTGNWGYLSCDVPGITEGKVYELSYDVVVDNGNDDDLYLDNHTTTNSTLNSTYGSTKVSFPNSGSAGTGKIVRWLQGPNNTDKIVFRSTSGGDYNSTIDNVSVKEVTEPSNQIFTLTKDEYYKLSYNIKATNYDQGNSTNNQGVYVKLFNHDAFGQRAGFLYGHGTANSSAGNISLDITPGTHSIIWKQSHTKNQLEIGFGPGFVGRISDFQVFAVTVNKTDYGPAISNDTRAIFDATIVSIDNNLLQLPLTEHRFWECELLDQEALFKDSFPRFAYRWKYRDGEYSAISAFTEVAFLPDEDYKYDANDGYNLSMENTVRRVILNNFDIMPHDVVELDILYKESNSNNIYTFTTIKGAELQNFTQYEITHEKYHALIESKQLLRPYDNVPRKAIAQEITANRIIFANYVQQYNITPSDEPIISTNITSTALTPSKEVGKSIKSLRKYQVGLSYLDKYGRQSPVFSNDTASFRLDQTSCGNANTITSSLNNFPPDWVTHYKYFVKDVAQPFYNISLDRFWQAENSDHVWLSFPSSDYNKVKEDDYIILKKKHNSDDPVTEEVDVKYKVLARKGSAPDFIKTIRKSVGGKIFNTDGQGLHFFSQSSYGGSAQGYPLVNKSTFRIKGNVVESNQAFKEAVIDDQTGRYIRIGKEISNKPSMFTNYYEILHVSRVDFGTNTTDDAFKGEEDYYEFTLVQPLGIDASFIGDSYSADRKLFLEYYREEFNEFDNSFEGKFFIKIARDEYFNNYIAEKQKIEDNGYNIVNAEDTFWAHIHESTIPSNHAACQVGATYEPTLLDTSRFFYNRHMFYWPISTNTTNWDPNNTDGKYGGEDKPAFPALAEWKVWIGPSGSETQRDNPYNPTWGGPDGMGDWYYEVDADGNDVPLTQRFCIEQAMAAQPLWGFDRKPFVGCDAPATYNPTQGSGFVMGNSYCSFSFQGIGDIDKGDDEAVGGGPGGGSNDPSTDADIDTNTWYDAANKELSAQWFNNFELLQQLRKAGTQFRWLDDPSETVYTITKVCEEGAIQRHHHKLPNGNEYGRQSVSGGAWVPSGTQILDKGKGNYAYRLDLQLDKPIVWSPTATLASGTQWNLNGDHTPLQTFKAAQIGTTSKLLIVEKRPSENTYTSFNPAVFEIVPKERADLNLYYETPKAGMILKDGMTIEALNNKMVNDGGTVGGNYNTEADVGSIYLPGGQPALSYFLNLGSEIVANHDFNTATTASAPSEMVTNGTFDSDVSSWTGDVVFDTNAARVPIDSSGSYAHMKQALSFTSGTTYTVNFKAKGTAANKIRVQDNTNNDGGLIAVNTDTALTTDWLSYSFTFTANSDSDTISFARNDSSQVSWSFYIDDVSVKEAYSAVEHWSIQSGMATTHDDTNDTVSIVSTAQAGSTAGLSSTLFELSNNQDYRLIVNVDTLDGNVGNGGPGATWRAVIVGYLNDGTWNNVSGGYYPLPGGNPSIQQGYNEFVFSVDSTLNQNSSKFAVKIEAYDASQQFIKTITLNEVSVTSIDVDFDKPITTIKTGEKYSWCDNPNKFRIHPYYWKYAPNEPIWSAGQDLPNGITIRISKRDEQGKVTYFKDYILNTDLYPDGGTNQVLLPNELLNWHNCFAFGNGVESHRLRDDYNAVVIDKGPRVSTTFEETYKEETLGSGMIFSGIYNSTSSVNQLNQFIQAENITKNLNPEYGTIQKLFTRNTNVVAFCENKILKVLANKDALYNADGSMQVTAADKVLGQAIPFVGEYGISRNPESFANFGYRVYFTDRDRGAVLRLSADGLTPISDKDMISYFKYNLPNNNTMIGSYDEDRDCYNLTLDTITVSFSEKVGGWTSFKSFLLESGVSINSEYYTWKNGDIWKHHTKALRNNFYNTQYESSVKLIFNDVAEEVKNFNTLNYEGSTSRIFEKSVGEEDQLTTNGWYTSYIKTDLESAEVTNFKDKEGKWFNNITGVSKTADDINLKDFTSQGLGLVTFIDADEHPNYKTLTIKAVTPISTPEVNAIGAGSGIYYNDTVDTGLAETIIPYPIGLTHAEDVLDSITGWEVKSPTKIEFVEHLIGDSGNQTADLPVTRFITGVINNLVNGNKYYIEATLDNLGGTSYNASQNGVGFQGFNMENLVLPDNRKRGTNGKISAIFTYNDNKYAPDVQDFGVHGKGIHLGKWAGWEGTIKDIKCINLTSKTDNLEYIVNTSSTDRTQTTSELKNNLEVGDTTQTNIYYFYIHSQTIGGLKYAVTSSNFTVTSSSDQVEVGVLTNLGSGSTGPGYYDNVVQIPLTVTFDQGNPFPNNNVESYINIQGTTTLAIDQ